MPKRYPDIAFTKRYTPPTKGELIIEALNINIYQEKNMSDSNSDSSLPAKAAVDDINFSALSGTLKDETITNKDIIVTGNFEGTNLNIVSTDIAYDIRVESSMKLVDCTVEMNSERLSDGAESIFLAKGASVEISGGSLNLRYSLYAADHTSLSIDGTSLSSPAGRFYLYSQGASVELKNLSVQDGALFQAYEDSYTFGYGEEHFSAENVSFGAGTSIDIGGTADFLMENCSFREGKVSEITFSRTVENDEEVALGHTNTKVIKNCDLSNVKISVDTISADGDGMIDLSGNYWGPGYDTVEKVLAILPSHKNIIITSVLTENPVLPDLSLQKPSLTGKDQVTFSWTGESGCSYRLLVDDVEVYSGSNTSFKYILKAGEHTYTVVSTDELGNQSVESSALTLNTTTGTLSTTGVPVFTVLNTELTGDGSLAWAIEQANACSGACRIEFADSLSGQQLSLVLPGLLDKSGFDGYLSATPLAERATMDGIALYNKEALVVVPSEVQLSLPKEFFFTTDLHFTGEQAHFTVSQNSSTVNIGSYIQDTSISLSNMALDFSGDRYNTKLNIRAVSSMEDCTITGADVSISANFEGKNLQFLSLENLGFRLEQNVNVTLKDSRIHINSSNSNIVYVATGAVLDMEGGCIDVNTRLGVDGTAILRKTTLTTSRSGYTFQLANYGTTLLEDLDVSASARVYGYGTGSLTLNGVVMGAKSELTNNATSSLDINNTLFLSGSQIKLTHGAADQTITGCNLANAKVTITSGTGEGKIDLSGNYWGEGVDTIEEIIALIKNYNADYVKIEDWLTEDPLAVKLTLCEPTLTKTGEGTTKALFSWAGDAGCEYRLLVDGVEVYKGTDTSFTHVLADGEHSYEVQATHTRGFTGKQTSEVLVDATAPVLTLKAATQNVLGTNATSITLSWQSSEAASYVVTVDGQVVYTGTDTSASFTVADGEHQYSVTATDAAGNASTQSSVCYTNTAGPELSLSPISRTVLSSGKSSVTLAWKSIAGTTYVVKVDDKEVYRGSDTSYTLALADGEHRYTVTATDPQSNTSSIKGDSFSLDATAPVLTLTKLSQTKRSTGKAYLNIAWKSSESASYELRVDGKLVYRGSGSAAQYALTDGTHKYSLTATDASGNKSTRSGSYLVDTKAPTRPSSLKVSQSRKSRYVTFGWKAVKDASGVSYELAVRKSGGAYTYYRNIKSARTSIRLSKDSRYSWRVRAVDGRGNSTSWVNGKTFNYDYTAPSIKVNAPKQSKMRTGRARVTLCWTSNETARYTLWVDNKKVYSGSGRSRTITLKDGKHSYKLTARDTSGNTVTRKGTWRVDTTAPTKLRKLAITLKNSGTQALFSWAATKDPSGVTYELAVRKAGGSYTYYKGLKSTSATLALTGSTTYEWRVRARDGMGNYTSWVSGKKFTSAAQSASTASRAKASAAASASTGLDRELALSAGSTAQQQSMASAATLGDTSLSLEQKKDNSLLSQSTIA